MSVPYKVISTGGAIVAGLVARKAVSAVRKGAHSTGTTPPDSPEHPDAGWAEAIAWVAASSAALAWPGFVRHSAGGPTTTGARTSPGAFEPSPS